MRDWLHERGLAAAGPRGPGGSAGVALRSAMRQPAISSAAGVRAGSSWPLVLSMPWLGMWDRLRTAEWLVMLAGALGGGLPGAHADVCDLTVGVGLLASCGLPHGEGPGRQA